jgi:hypothetical protein
MDGLNHPKKNTTMVEPFDAKAAWLFQISQTLAVAPLQWVGRGH